jgi:basic amino acid/polyamine antiporter, APA family
MANIWVRKSIATLEAEAFEPDVQAMTTHDGVPLKRSLSALNLVSLGIGAIIGAGIFVLTGHAAAANAGPAISLSFVFGAFACAFAGLCYAEMASTVPIAGSAFTYAYSTMGELIAWIIGWDLILEYALGATTVAIGWSGYVVSFLNDFGNHCALRLCRLAARIRPFARRLAYDGRAPQRASDGRHCRNYDLACRRRARIRAFQ